jgi:hypothetical protein
LCCGLRCADRVRSSHGWRSRGHRSLAGMRGASAWDVRAGPRCALERGTGVAESAAPFGSQIVPQKSFFAALRYTPTHPSTSAKFCRAGRNATVHADLTRLCMQTLLTPADRMSYVQGAHYQKPPHADQNRNDAGFLSASSEHEPKIFGSNGFAPDRGNTRCTCSEFLQIFFS